VATISLEAKNDQWWLVDAAGAPFVSCGINHVHATWLYLEPYNLEHSLATYGSDLIDASGKFNPHGEAAARWLTRTVERLKGWGFNTLGKHTLEIPFERVDLFYVASVETDDQVDWLYAPGTGLESWRYEPGRGWCPDFFSDAFAQRMGSIIRTVCQKHRNNANLLGYTFSDIPPWEPLESYPEAYRSLHPWIQDIIRLPGHSPVKNEWIEVLQRNHPSAQDVGRVYGLEGATWEQLRSFSQWSVTGPKDVLVRDSQAMMQRMAVRYYSLLSQLIRREDPHHLILGDKLEYTKMVPDWFLPAVKDCIDLVCLQIECPFEAQRAFLEKAHRQTGKPILNGDSGFCCAKKQQSQLPVKGWPCRDLDAVGKVYYDFMQGIMGLPYMVGWHHCGYMEQWDGSTNIGGAFEGGFMDPFENEYEAALRHIREANRLAPQWHATAGHRTTQKV